MTPEERAAENRRKFPEIAEIVDKFRASGATVKLLWAENEKGETIGRYREMGDD